MSEFGKWIPEYNIKVYQPVFMTADLVKKLPKSQKTIIAEQISQLLVKHKEHMLQFKPQQLIEQFMNAGDAVIIWDGVKNVLIGFAKNYLWPGQNESGQLVYEFGSWIVQPEYSDKGFGHVLALMAVNAAKTKDPNAQIIAVCGSDNDKPIGILEELGAHEIGKPANVKILLGEGQATVKLIDMSDLLNFKQ